jgi:hypothetical protein
MGLRGTIKEPIAIASHTPGRVDLINLGMNNDTSETFVTGAPWSGRIKAGSWASSGGWFDSRFSLVSRVRVIPLELQPAIASTSIFNGCFKDILL